MNPEVLVGYPVKEFYGNVWRWFIDYAVIQPSGKITTHQVSGNTVEEAKAELKKAVNAYNDNQPHFIRKTED